MQFRGDLYHLRRPFTTTCSLEVISTIYDDVQFRGDLYHFRRRAVPFTIYDDVRRRRRRRRRFLRRPRRRRRRRRRRHHVTSSILGNNLCYCSTNY